MWSAGINSLQSQDCFSGLATSASQDGYVLQELFEMNIFWRLGRLSLFKKKKKRADVNLFLFVGPDLRPLGARLNSTRLPPN